jgi:tetratricopeptide (TPR) repeat protein
MKYVLYGGRSGQAHPDLVATLVDLGKVSRDLNANEDARHFFKLALKGLYDIHGREAINQQIAIALTQLGGLSFCTGLLNDSKKYFEQALDMKFKLYGDNVCNDDIGSTMNNLGSLHARMKNYHTAFSYYRLALDQYTRLSKEKGNEDNPEIKTHMARTLHNLGLLSYNLKQYDEAKKFYSESLKIKSDVFKDRKDAPDLALTLSKLSSVEVKQGKFQTAKFYQDQAIKRSPTFLETHKDLINRYLLPETPEEAAILINTLPPGKMGGDTNSALLLKSLDLWKNEGHAHSSKSCWYPFKGFRNENNCDITGKQKKKKPHIKSWKI